MLQDAFKLLPLGTGDVGICLLPGDGPEPVMEGVKRIVLRHVEGSAPVGTVALPSREICQQEAETLARWAEEEGIEGVLRLRYTLRSGEIVLHPTIIMGDQPLWARHDRGPFTLKSRAVALSALALAQEGGDAVPPALRAPPGEALSLTVHELPLSLPLAGCLVPSAEAPLLAVLGPSRLVTLKITSAGVKLLHSHDLPTAKVDGPYLYGRIHAIRGPQGEPAVILRSSLMARAQLLAWRAGAWVKVGEMEGEPLSGAGASVLMGRRQARRPVVDGLRHVPLWGEGEGGEWVPLRAPKVAVREIRGAEGVLEGALTWKGTLLVQDRPRGRKAKLTRRGAAFAMALWGGQLQVVTSGPAFPESCRDRLRWHRLEPSGAWLSVWSSEELQAAVVSIMVGDVTGDGQGEIIALGRICPSGPGKLFLFSAPEGNGR